jgi:hypothetical protein
MSNLYLRLDTLHPPRQMSPPINACAATFSEFYMLNDRVIPYMLSRICLSIAQVLFGLSLCIIPTHPFDIFTQALLVSYH